MTLPLTPDILRAAYDYLNSTPPFARWNLPDSDDVKFVVSKHKQFAGWHEADRKKHTIAISIVYVGHTHTLLAIMAHEMVHLHQVHSGMHTGGEHNRAFAKLAQRVAAIHGFDPKMF